MKKEIRDSLRASIAEFMDKNKITWGSAQKTSIKKVLGCPVEWQTLYNIATDDTFSPHVNNQAKLLAFFRTPHQKTFGVINLIENEE